MGFKFRRQAPRGSYVADFLCAEARLVVEVEGGQHADQRSVADRQRTADLERKGPLVLRFWNVDVHTNIEGVLTVIAVALAERGPPHRARESAPSSPQGERRTEPWAGAKEA